MKHSFYLLTLSETIPDCDQVLNKKCKAPAGAVITELLDPSRFQPLFCARVIVVCHLCCQVRAALADTAAGSVAGVLTYEIVAYAGLDEPVIGAPSRNVRDVWEA